MPRLEEALRFSLSSSESPPPAISNNLWIVCASTPHVSVIRFAALPVGAASRISSLSISKYFIMALIVVVFPVPGPPVITISPLSAANATARFCISSSIMFSDFSISAMRSYTFPVSSSHCILSSRRFFATFCSMR